MNNQEGPPGQESRMLLAMLATFAVMAFFFPGAPVDQVETPAVVAETEQFLDEEALSSGVLPSAPGLVSEPLAEAEPATEQLPLVESSFSNPAWESSFSSGVGGPTSFILRNYTGPRSSPGFMESISGLFGGGDDSDTTEPCPESSPVNLIEDGSSSFLSVRLAGATTVLGSRGWQVEAEADDFVTYVTREGDLEVRRTYRMPESGFYLSHQVEFRNVGRSTLQVDPVLEMADAVFADEGGGGLLFGRFGGRQRGAAINNGGLKSWLAHDLADEPETRDGGVRWAGIAEQYFLSVLVPTADDVQAAIARSVVSENANEANYDQLPARVLVEMPLGRTELAAGTARSFDFGLYMGPKVISELGEADSSLKSSVDFGFLAFIAAPIHWFLVFLNGFVHSYGIAIILLTVLMKLLLFPLNQKAGRSMKAMQALQPRLKELQTKYEDDPQGKNLATMELFKKEGVNPMGGCLPMILQMPIWFALYRVLWVSIELYHESFLYLCDLTVKDPYGFLPILYGVAMYANQLIMPNTISDPTQKMVMRVMPLLFVPVMFGLPSGLILYIVVSIILGAVQQWYINKSLSIPEPNGSGAGA